MKLIDALTLLKKRDQCCRHGAPGHCLIIDCEECPYNYEDGLTEHAIRTLIYFVEVYGGEHLENHYTHTGRTLPGISDD